MHAHEALWDAAAAPRYMVVTNAVRAVAGYDSGKTRDLPEILGYTPHIATMASRPRSRPPSAGRWSGLTRG